MGVDIYGSNPQAESGEYYRSNWWCWRPIPYFIEELGEKKAAEGDGRLLEVFYSADGEEGEEHGHGFSWHHNDGRGLTSEEDCEFIADELEKADWRKEWEDRQATLDALPDIECKYCKGTGERDDLGKTPNRTEPQACNVCGAWDETERAFLKKGTGKARPPECSYPYSVQAMEDFIKFLRNCGGGFEIC